jgi:hypothetical protein
MEKQAEAVQILRSRDHHVTYRDFSGATESDEIILQLEKQSNAKDHAFPTRLHYVLSDLEKDGLGHIASWQPHGRCFIVHDLERFITDVLMRWFNMSKISSFHRQLNLYGFKRISQGPDRGGHYHELFLRSKGFLTYYMKRTKVKGEGPRKAHDASSEPNFHQMPPLPAEPLEAVPTTSPAIDHMPASSAATASLPSMINMPVPLASLSSNNRAFHPELLVQSLPGAALLPVQRPFLSPNVLSSLNAAALLNEATRREQQILALREQDAAAAMDEGQRFWRQKQLLQEYYMNSVSRQQGPMSLLGTSSSSLGNNNANALDRILLSMITRPLRPPDEE